MFDFGQVGERDVAVYGAGGISRAFIAMAQAEGLHDRIKGIVVSSLVHAPTEIDGIAVHKASDFLPLHKDCFVVLAVRDRYVESVASVLRGMGMSDYARIDMADCVAPLEKKFEEVAPGRASLFFASVDRASLTDEEYVMFLGKQLKTGMLNFEVSLVEHCNLNCQCCNHFSPLSPEKFLDLEIYERDLKRLSELYRDNRGTLMLLGGEPLLYPRIAEAIRAARRYFPHMGIDVVTNGLLMKKMGAEFWKACKDSDVYFSITKYPVNFDYDSLVPYAESMGCGGAKFTYDSSAVKTTYRLPLVEEGGLNAYKNFSKCYHANTCVTLKDGRLYTCPISANMHIFNAHFKKTLPEGEVNSIDIFGAESAEEIEAFLNTPIPLCAHCDIYGYEYDIPWKNSSGNIIEWLEVSMHKIVLWGAGNRGRQFVVEFGSERVAAIVDSDPELWNRAYRGVPVVSPDVYFAQYSEYPILVTVQNHIEEIVASLHQKRIYATLNYETDFRFAEVFLKAFSFSMIEPLSSERQYAVYGFSLLGIMLYERLRKMGLKCTMVIERSRVGLPNDARNRLGFDFETLESAARADAVLCASMPLEEADKAIVGSAHVQSFYGLFYERDMFRNPAIERFRNVHAGRRCFVVATGPSLRISDLDALRGHGELCISMNSIYNAFPDTAWRPDYYVLSDPEAMIAGKDKILAMEAEAKFISDIAWPFGDCKVKDNLYKWHYIRDTMPGALPEVSEDFSLGAHYGSTITFEGALTLAFYMGCAEIYLLGVDCTSYGKRNAHFKNVLETGMDYCFTPDSSCSYSKNVLAYQSAKAYADAHGIRIYNATRGGALEVFERADFDALMNERRGGGRKYSVIRFPVRHAAFRKEVA